jgi:hypothetical protein
VPETRRSFLSPEILADRPVAAEVLVGPQAISVILALPELDPRDADVILTRHTIRLRSRSHPERVNVLVPLPVGVEPERYVLRGRNGVYDFVIERLSR